MLKGAPAITGRPGIDVALVDLDEARSQAAKATGVKITDEDLNGWLMYSKVFADYMKRHREYGPVRVLPTPVFLWNAAG